MNLGISGKVAMVAASSKGIGLAIAQALHAEGCRLSLCARSMDSLDAACLSLGGATGFVCDVSDRESIESWFRSTVNELGSPDILVTNTGGPPAGPWESITDEQWRQGFESTLLNVVRLVRLASEPMKANGWGRIVHLTSIVAKQPHALLPISSTLRAGLMGLTRLQATSLAEHGITVNSVLPGHTLTDRQVQLARVRSEREGISEQQALEEQARLIPMRRLANPEEIASTVAFLCSEKASYVTGVNLLVDGGLTLGHG